MSYNYQGVAASSTEHLPGPGPIGDKPPGPYGYGFAPDAVRSSGGGIAKWKIIAGVVGVLAIIGIATGVGVGVSMSKKNKGSSSSSGSSSGSSNVNMDDPSKFDKDSKLHLSLYGLAYTPENSLLPNCGNKLEDVIRDVQLISQLTTRIRLYGADCNQSALVLEAIQRTKVNLNVYLGNYVVPEDADTVYNRQKTAIQQAIQTYGTDHIAGITVGNEFMLNYLNANGATDPDSTVGNAGAAILTKFISDTRTMLSGMSLTKTIPVGTSDAGSFFNTQVLSAVDYGLSNVHPWFANTTIDNAAGWTYSFFQDTNVAKAQSLTNKPEMYIAETGWPSKSSDAGNANNGASDASVPNLQKFIDTFVCQANTNGTKYFYFEYSDEPWKDKQFGGVEGWWGLFNSDRTLKALTIPDCAAP